MISPELIDKARDFELEMQAIANVHGDDLAKMEETMVAQMALTLEKLGFARGVSRYYVIHRKLKKEEQKHA